MSIVIELEGVWAGYGAQPMIRDVSLRAEAGKIISLLGANGAGKTTLLRAIAGEIEIQRGRSLWKAAPAKGTLDRRVRDGLGYIPQERSLVMGLTVRDNLRLGQGAIADALELFPVIEALLSRPAGLLSGGEQQMLILARTLASKPAALVIDELSLGLAPVAVRALLPALRAAAEDGVAVILVEQSLDYATAVADHAYVMRQGQIVLDGAPADLPLSEIEAGYMSAAPTRSSTANPVPEGLEAALPSGSNTGGER
jgi:branched-chain amino acid transport system ATP-binding protein